MIERDPIAAETVTPQLERILASRGFTNAGRLSRLLRFVVDKTLAGETDELKEYSVGVEVFDRGEKYDPRLDSIVRVEAGRLRSRLDEDYNGEGANDEIRIVLPRGGYSARFERRATQVIPSAIITESAKPLRSRTMWAVGIGGTLAAATVVWLASTRSSPGLSTIAVLAFEQYSASGEDESVAAQLTDGVTAELARLGTLGVVSHTSAMQFSGQRRLLREIAAALDADVIMEASVESNPDGIVVVARLVNAETDRKMWVENFPGKVDDLRDLNRRIAVAVSTAVLARSGAP